MDINQIPVEIKYAIFQFVSPRDTITVCKEWYQITKRIFRELKFKRLISKGLISRKAVRLMMAEDMNNHYLEKLQNKLNSHNKLYNGYEVILFRLGNNVGYNLKPIFGRQIATFQLFVLAFKAPTGNIIGLTMCGNKNNILCATTKIWGSSYNIMDKTKMQLAVDIDLLSDPGYMTKEGVPYKKNKGYLEYISKGEHFRPFKKRISNLINWVNHYNYLQLCKKKYNA